MGENNPCGSTHCPKSGNKGVSRLYLNENVASNNYCSQCINFPVDKEVFRTVNPVKLSLPQKYSSFHT